MTSFRPTVAPAGRLVRLGVVLDTRNAPDRLREVARMCDRAGIDALWVRDDPVPADGRPRLEAWTALRLAGLDASRARLGAMLDVTLRPPATLAAMAGTLYVALDGRLEIGFSREPAQRAGAVESPDPATRARRVQEYATVVRRLLAGESAGAVGSAEQRDAPLGVPSPQPGGPRLSVEVSGPPDVAAAVRVADDVLIPAMAVKDIRLAVEKVRKECEAAGRGLSSLGIGVELPVSIGRTSAEARARADAEPLFQTIGHPAEVGIFGTLEQCQDRVIELAHLGVTDVRCVLPNSADVHDVIAQLTAMAVGTMQALTPNAPRSRPPDPPEGWGGSRSLA